MALYLPGARGADGRLFSGQRATVDHGIHDPNGVFDRANAELQGRIGAFLARVYPGHPWAVFAEIEHGIVKIAVQGFLQWPYLIKVEQLKSDPRMEIVMRGAGELLERLRMPRSTFSLADWRAAMKRLPYHMNRNKNPDKVIA